MLTKIMVLLTMWWMSACTPAEAVNSPQQAEGEAASEQTQPAAPPAPDIVVPKDVPAEVPQPQLPAEVNELLDRLEKNANDLQSFTAEVQYEKEDALLGRKELRAGTLIYQQDAENKQKRFAILFDKTIVDRVQRGEAKHYIFDGRWLAEIDHANKQFIKREVVAPGKQLDPLKLGEGPFPLPVGQPKADVLARFDVTRASVPETGFLKDLKNVEGLSLVPKAGGREAKDFASILIFYDQQSLLPVGMRMVETNGDHKTIRLLNAKRNPTLSESQQQQLNIAEPNRREWRISIIPWGE